MAKLFPHMRSQPLKYHHQPNSEKWYRKRFTILGRSVSISLIMALLVVGLVAAALLIIMSWEFSGSIRKLTSVPDPDPGTTWTNDDSVIYNSLRDEGDNGMDPNQEWQVGGVVTRQSYDLQLCEAAIVAGNIEVTITDAHEGVHCAVGATFTNNTGDDLAIDSVTQSGADFDVVLSAMTPRCYTLLDTESGTIAMDLTPITDAAGGAFSGASIDIVWGIPATIGCP